MIGYSISLAVSVNKLTKDKIQTVFVMYFITIYSYTKVVLILAVNIS